MDLKAHYRVQRLLGRGGMAEVLEAIQLGQSGLQRRVAIKRMLPHAVPNQTLVRMFLDEARIASQLHHANIVAVLDYGVLDEVPFQVLEFVDGTDARQLALLGAQSGKPLGVELALYLAAQVGYGLDYAHSATTVAGHALGIVHRDVKPANVLVSWAGDVKLTDFGIAFANDRAEATLDGDIKGTPSFMAPEQLLKGTVDGRTDVFALGCLLHTFIVGKSPLSYEGAVKRLLSGEGLELDPAVPEDVKAIVAKATQRMRDHRYQTAAEMTAEIGRALASRVREDPRAIMQAWLTKVRPPSPKAAAASFDGEVDVEVVFAGDASGTRQFQSRTSDGEAAAASDTAPSDRMAAAAGGNDALPPPDPDKPLESAIDRALAQMAKRLQGGISEPPVPRRDTPLPSVAGSTDAAAPTSVTPEATAGPSVVLGGRGDETPVRVPAVANSAAKNLTPGVVKSLTPGVVPSVTPGAMKGVTPGAVKGVTPSAVDGAVPKSRNDDVFSGPRYTPAAVNRVDELKTTPLSKKEAKQGERERSSLGIYVIAFIFGAGGAGAFAYWKISSQPPPEPPPPAPLVVAAPPDMLPPPVDAAVLARGHAHTAPGKRVAATPPAATTPAPAAMPPPRPSTATAANPPAATTPATPAVAAATPPPTTPAHAADDPTKPLGVLDVGSGALTTPEIIVDGHGRGYAPKRLSLPIGAHKIELVSAAGRLGPSTVTLSESNTIDAPAKFPAE